MTTLRMLSAAVLLLLACGRGDAILVNVPMQDAVTGPNEAAFSLGLPVSNDDFQVVYNEAAITHIGDTVVAASNSIGYLCTPFADITQMCLTPDEGVHVRLFTSTDGGDTFSMSGMAEIELPNYPIMLYQQASDPFLTQFAGTFYFTFIALSNYVGAGPGGLDCSAPNEMLMTKSTDGVNWSTPIQISPSGNDYLHDRPNIVADQETGRLWAFWNGFRNGDAGICGGHVGKPYVHYSDDGGDTWSGPISVLPNPGTPPALTAPVNMVSINGMAYAAYFVTDTSIKVVKIRAPLPGQTPYTPSAVHLGLVPSRFVGTDHYYLPDMPRTRLNSMVEIARSPAGDALMLAWTELNTAAEPDQTRVMVTTTHVPGSLLGSQWRVPTNISDLATHLTEDSTFIPISAWGVGPGICAYHRDGLTNSFAVRCYHSANRGATWTALNAWLFAGYQIGTGYVPGEGGVICSPKQVFLGDYNDWDGEYIAFTNILRRAEGAAICAYRPFIEVIKYPAGGVAGCSVDPSSPSGWWLVLPLVLLVPLRRRV